MRPQREDFAQLLRGFLMGGADIIPGVSGGTVALILGIYQRLVTAISHVDRQLLHLLAERQWREAANHLDLRFLVTLGIGILTGIALLARVMLYLLLEQRKFTLAVFFGLILASSLIVAKTVRPRGSGQAVAAVLLALGAAIFAFWLVGQDQVGFHDHLGYFFLCGTVAICAMILPGVSGAYILWLLGAYVAVTEIIHKLPSLECSSRELVSLIVFASGCAVGLICFSKLLKWLLERAHMPTMAVLAGFLVGSLRLMWPFQNDLTPDVEKLKLKRFEQVMPASWDRDVTICLILALVAIAAILLLERWGRSTDID